jgi:hypothetical protein
MPRQNVACLTAMVMAEAAETRHLVIPGSEFLAWEQTSG